MEYEFPEPDRKRKPDEHKVIFPSTQFVITVYCFGALTSLMAAFYPPLDAAHSTNCLVLSWVLALCALGISIFSDAAEQVTEDFD